MSDPMEEEFENPLDMDFSADLNAEEMPEPIVPMDADVEMGEAGGEPKEERRNDSPENAYKRSIFSIPVDVQVTIGTARPTVAELLQMRRDSLIQLTSKIDDPVELYVGNRVIARGELVEADGGAGTIGVRLTEIVDMSEASFT